MMHKNPAYILYSDPTCLNKWGFLYVQYKATAYWFVLPVLGYILCKSVFIAFAQKSPIAQAVCLVIIEAVALVGVCVLRPWMDKKTNIFNISIAVVNFLNGCFLLIFSNAFGQPEMVSGIMGVLFAVLLIMVLVASVYAIVSKNPETRYQPMRDDRGSFIKSQSALTTELDALGATARGDNKTPFGRNKGLDDDDSFSTDSLSREPQGGNSPVPPGTGNSAMYRDREPVSPVDSALMYPSDNTGRRGPPAPMQQQQRGGNGPYGSGNDYANNNWMQPTGPSPYQRAASSHSNYQNNDYPRQPQFRQQTNASPWQRGAGYEH
jgi:Transient receptor potential (TRP) ion channel